MTFSRNWLEQSAEAASEGVCHTEAECRQMYSEISQDKKDAATSMFRKEADDLPAIKQAIAEDADHWNVPYHLWWGMAVRNLFRREGFNEDYFGIDNLDCIYKFLVENAVKE